MTLFPVIVMNCFTKALALLAVYLLQPFSLGEAALVVRVGDGSVPQVTAGNSVTLSVVVFNDGEVGSRVINGYDLGFDFGPAGKLFGPDFEFADFSVAFNPAFAGGAVMQEATAAATNYDIRFQSSGNASTELNATTAAAPFSLFDVTIQTDVTTPNGFYDFVFRPDASNQPPFGAPVVINQLGPLATTANGGPILQPLGGQFEITGASAVPEPTSMLALTGVFAACGARRWRKRNASSSI